MSQNTPAVGSPAPEFTVSDQTGQTVSLTDFRGKSTVALYFYPKADTPGCTKESCAFRDAHPRYTGQGAVILGISPDTVKRQANFAEKFDLPFTLLADADHAIADAYGVWKEKSFMGRKYMGVERTTFVIDRQGIVRAVFAKMDLDKHAEEVLAAVTELELATT